METLEERLKREERQAERDRLDRRLLKVNFPAGPSREGFGYRARYSHFNPAWWARRDFARDTALLVESWATRLAAPNLPTVMRWLDYRDGHPSFETREATQAYENDRAVYAEALHAAAVLLLAAENA